MNKDIFIKNIKAAGKAEACDLVIKNITIVDVFQNSTYISDVAIANGYIVGIGNYSGKKEIDGTGKFICPSLIDAHAHIESSLLTPREYYKAALLHGITSMVVDPHEIGNVLGLDGINFMLSSSENIPFDFYFMLPSCVPATNFETTGANLDSQTLAPLYKNPKVLGLAEVMNYPAVTNCEADMIDKLLTAQKNNAPIDGHCAGFTTDLVNIYATANIKTDHECHTFEELISRVRRGIYVLIREGTVAKNLNNLIKGASILNSRRLCLCTDDKHMDDLIKNGSIDNSVKLCISNGLMPETAIQMATLNTAECYGFKTKGAIAPGYIADFLILDSLESFAINSVYKNGTLVVKDNNLLITDSKDFIYPETKVAMNFPQLSIKDFEIDISHKNLLHVMEIIPNKLETNHLKLKIADLKLKDKFLSQTSNLDLLKIAVIERHKATGNIGLGIIRGLKLKSGAIATTIAHDSHNLIVAGTNDNDMLFAINELKKIGGGIIVVQNNTVLASITLEIGGLITARKAEAVIQDLAKLHEAIDTLSPKLNFNPFLTMSFLSLPVIPSLRITDKGLFDVEQFEFIGIASV